MEFKMIWIFWGICALIIAKSLYYVKLSRNRMLAAKARMEEAKVVFEKKDQHDWVDETLDTLLKKEKKKKKNEVRSIFDESENSW